ncbi:MAG: permease [Planctomycetes bacterium]|nr:permease [Planctomycetota bacterium]
MTRYAWARWGDVNAFFGLVLDNVAVLILLVGMVTSDDAIGDSTFTRDFVLTQMIPGTALGVLLGDLVYTWLAFRLARRTARSDVTAMPLGLDTPSTFAVGGLVLLPALRAGMTQHGMSHEQAMTYGWHVGMAVLMMVGLIKTVIAPFGSAVRRWIPRAGLLGSLAAIALALIAFMPLWQHVAAVPLVGMATLAIVLVTLVAHRSLPGRFPGALAAVVVGVLLYFGGAQLGHYLDVPLVPPAEATSSVGWRLSALLPDFTIRMDWWEKVLGQALASLPVMFPFALATVVGGIDCTESAAAAGDEYDTRAILLTEGLASLAAGACGGVIQNTPYIGHPAYKTMGGRAAYTLATGIVIGLGGILGGFTEVFGWLPAPAMFPILVFIGLEITAQSFRATPPAHYPALAVAALPALAYLATIPLGPGLGTDSRMIALRCLANGFIVTSLLWAAALAEILDGKLARAALYLVVAGGLALVGIIHSPLNPAAIAWPGDVYTQMQQMSSSPSVLCQSPYHWFAAYLLMAGVLLALAAFKSPPVTRA